MKTYRTLTLGAIAVLGLIATCASPATSAEINASGTLTFVRTQFERIPLAGGKFLNETHLKGVLLASDPSLPPHLASQDCDFATSLDDKGTPTQGYGYCATIDKDGDVYWIWLSSVGPSDRKWTVVLGTGKFARMTGSGTTEVLMATADGRITLALSGTLNMK
jgi:hypothetical protein